MRFFVPVSAIVIIIVTLIIGCGKRATQFKNIASAKSQAKESEIGKRLDSTQREFLTQIKAEENRVVALSRVVMRSKPIPVSASEAVHSQWLNERNGRLHDNPPE